MNTTILKSLLVTYENKRNKKIEEAENRKLELYKNNPRFEEIDAKLSSLSITASKNLINSSNFEYLDNLRKEIEKLKREKHDLLLSVTHDENYLQPIYDCDQCKDTGYITTLNQKTEMCNCLKQKLINISYNKSNLSNLQKENFQNFNINKFSDEVNMQKYGMKISPRENIKTIRKASETFIQNFENPDTKNLFFTGNTGLGKTYMTNCIANELLQKGKTVIYQTAPVLLETIIDNKFNKYKTSNSNNFYNQILEANLLIIDDLGAECINTMKLSEIFTILNSRILNLNNKITKTIISTNLSIEQIFNVYEERIGSRIAGFYDIYYFFGEDIRLKK